MSLLKKFDLKTIMIMALCVVLLLRSCGGEEGEKEIVNVDGKDYELLEQKVDTIVVDEQLQGHPGTAPVDVRFTIVAQTE